MAVTDIAPRNGTPTAEIVERVLLVGDLAKLSPDERVRYYGETCSSLGLNPLTQPFQYITLNSKLTLYATKGCTDQLRAIHGLNVRIVGRETSGEGIHVVTARATMPNGREDEDVGAVSVKGLAGEFLANAMMKATTKAKRRVTLSIIGLGMLDESETASIPDARPVSVNLETGEILEAAPQPKRQSAPQPSEPVIEDQPEESPRARLLRIAKASTSLLTTEQRDALKARAAELGLPPSPAKAQTDDEVIGWIALIEEATEAARPF